MLQIIKKELKQIFVTPAYFIILALFIGILNFLFLKWFFLDGQMNLRSYFDLQVWFLMIFIPAISMRIMSEEFKNGSIEFLLTKPLSILNIILWKYLSQVIYFWIFIVSTIILYLSLATLWNFPSWIIVSQLFGSIVLIFAMFAVSFLASSITKNQVFAFLLWVLINFILIIIWTDFIQISLPYFLANFLNDLSYISHFENFSKWLVSLTDIFYFTSIIFFSLYLSYLSVNNFRKTWSIWLKALVLWELAVVSIILIFSNALISKVNIFADLTPNNIYTLSSSTKEILNNVDDIVNIDLYASKDLPPQLKTSYTRVKDLIWEFNKYSSSNIHLKEIHPIYDDKETEAMQDGISPVQIQILEDDQFATKKWYLWLAIKYSWETESIAYLWQTENLEYSLISKILKLTNDNKKEVSILASEDIDNQIVSIMKQILEENYEVRTQNIYENTTEIYNKDSDIYLILEADEKFWTGIINNIKNIIADKTALYFFQPTKVDLTNWLIASENHSDLEKQLLEKYNLELEKWLVWDAKYNSSVSVWQWFISYRLPYPLFPKSFVNRDLPISEWIQNVNTPFISAIKENDKNWSYEVKNLLTTSDYGILRDSINNISPDSFKNITENDLEKLDIAKLIIDWNSKLAFIPSTYMFTLWGQQALIENLGFVSNLTDFIWWDSRLINIRSKTLEYETFVWEKDSKNMIRWFNVFALPIIIVLIWIIIAFIRNRKRA